MRELTTWINMASKEEVKSLCEEYISGKSESHIPQTIATGISQSKLNLLQVVEALGSWLTSEEVDNRARGTKLLSDILSIPNGHAFLASEIQYFVAFYCDRLMDNAVVIPYVLQGLLALASTQSLSDEDAVSVIRLFFREVHNQSHPHGSRRTAYLILNKLLTTHPEAVCQISSEFMLGFVQSIDGEKDPRNLLIVFDTVPLITTHLNLEVMVEDLFEVLACYFPINFTPSPTDPDAISKDDLVLALRNALTSTHHFAEHLIPLLLEKLSSDLHGSKIDSLDTISVGASVFGSIEMSPHLQSIWTAISKEVLYPVADNVEAASIACMSAVMEGVRDSTEVQQQLIAMMLKDSAHYLQGPDLALLRSSARLLLSVATHPSLYTAITTDLFPTFLRQLGGDCQVSHKIVLLKVISDFLKVKRDNHPKGAEPDPLLQSLYPLLLGSISDPNVDLSAAALNTIHMMLCVSGVSQDEAGMGCGDILRLALNTDNMTIRAECGACLGALGGRYPSVALQLVLPSLLTRLCQGEGSSGAGNVVTVEMVTAVSTHYDVMMTSLHVLTDRFSSLAQESDSSCSNGQLAVSISNAVKVILQQTSHIGSCVVEFYSKTVIPQMLSAFITSSHIDSVLSCEDVLSNVADLLRDYVLLLEPSEANSFSMTLLQSFISGNVKQLLPTHNNISCCSVSFQPFQPSSPWQQTQLLSFVTAVLSASQVFPDISFASQLLAHLIEFILNSSHTHSIKHAAMGCGCIANRINEDSVGVVEKELERVWSVVVDTGSSTRKSGLSVINWVCKGLLLRSHDLVLTYSQKLLYLFEDTELSVDVVAGFSDVLLTDTPACLNQQCKTNIRLFHKQWYFSKMVPQLVALYHSSVSIRSHVISVLSVLMQSVPKLVLLNELPKLLPLLLESLDPSSTIQSDVLISSLSALSSLIGDAPVIIGSHVTSLVPRLLHIVQSDKQMNVRTRGLQCLTSLTLLPAHLLYPHRDRVTRGLTPCLDDKKRLVRREAVQCRNSWYML